MPSPDNPILNSAFEAPRQHWALDLDGGFTAGIVPKRRRSEYLVPIAPPRRTGQRSFQFELPDQRGEAAGPNAVVEEIRSHLEPWRRLPVGECGVTHETARLLEHWRSGETKPPLFFCQLEAVETIIWLEEVAARQPNLRHLRDSLKAHADQHNPGLFRIAAKVRAQQGGG
jgi:type III restriction enzyme